MPTITKEKILEEIRRTAKENGGKPLGINRFGKETGIKPYDWKKYWARFGDAQKEAGFLPNQLQSSYDDEFLFEKVVGVIRKLGKFPTYDEFGIERNLDSEFPHWSVFRKFGSKWEFAKKILQYATNKSGYEDIVALCEPVLEKSSRKESGDDNNISISEVYLFKSGRYYKIGKTNDTVRRGNEIRIQLPEKMGLIHSIKTDDPSGVEAYWHRRFEAKRMQGEWFDLNSSDLKAFKRWRRIV